VPGQDASQATGPVWLCRPGQAADPCAYSLAVTAVTPGGTLKRATWPPSALASKFACFYVHPTDSLAQTANTGLALNRALPAIAGEPALAVPGPSYYVAMGLGLVVALVIVTSALPLLGRATQPNNARFE
jgi:hypothetical protein